MPRNLWGDLTTLEKVRTPKSILQEQASYLTQATEGVLVGSLDDARLSGRGSFTYDLEVEVPALNGYTFTLLRINHSVELYPVQVTSTSAKVDVTCPDEPT